MIEEIITKHMNGIIEASNKTYTYESIEYTGALFRITIPINI